MNYTAIWFLRLEFSKKSWSRQLRLLFQNDTINLHLPKILFNLLLFDDTKGDTTSKSMKFKTIRMTRIIRTTFSNVDNPHQNLTTGFSLRESNHRFKIKLIQKTKILKIFFFFRTLKYIKVPDFANSWASIKKSMANYTATFCKSIQYFREKRPEHLLLHRCTLYNSKTERQSWTFYI